MSGPAAGKDVENKISYDDLCRIVGRNFLETQIELERVKTIARTQMDQLQAQLEAARRESKPA